MSENTENCQECQKSLVVKQVVNESTEYEYHSLRKSATEKKVCSECWNKNQEQYKQEFGDITETKERWLRGGICSSDFEPIQAQCWEKGCRKKFDCQTAEKLRHNWLDNKLSFSDHEELNKNSAPIKTMEDLVQQWMTSEGLQKIYFENGEMKCKKTDGKIGEWLFGSFGWAGKVEEWLKEQPNKEVICKGGDNPQEREREREREHFGLFKEKQYQIHYFTERQTSNWISEFTNGN